VQLASVNRRLRASVRGLLGLTARLTVHGSAFASGCSRYLTRFALPSAGGSGSRFHSGLGCCSAHLTVLNLHRVHGSLVLAYLQAMQAVAEPLALEQLHISLPKDAVLKSVLGPWASRGFGL
jgi:hypothetical protein